VFCPTYPAVDEIMSVMKSSPTAHAPQAHPVSQAATRHLGCGMVRQNLESIPSEETGKRSSEMTVVVIKVAWLGPAEAFADVLDGLSNYLIW
jgi:hypothetical protein